MPALLRIPYTDPLPLPQIIPASANTASGAIAALVDFLSTTSSRSHSDGTNAAKRGTLLLTGAGISVASGLADYRGTNGTYTLNRTYRPIYFNEFCENHEARKRYWARSFLGWTTLEKARPNKAHEAVGKLGQMGIVRSVITQNVDSFHPISHPHLHTLELHGYLRSLTCLTCASSYPRSAFQSQLAALNPTWDAFLKEIIATGALDTENPAERHKKGLKTNPDGDVDIPDAPYTTFRYPACPVCLEGPSPERGVVRGRDGEAVKVHVDRDGAWLPSSNAGILKPAVVMFGESIPSAVKVEAENAIDTADRILVVGSSLATYSAWRLVKRAHSQGMPIAVLNMGGVRGEEAFFDGVPEGNTGREAVRAAESAQIVLPKVVKILESMKRER